MITTLNIKYTVSIREYNTANSLAFYKNFDNRLKFLPLHAVGLLIYWFGNIKLHFIMTVVYKTQRKLSSNKIVAMYLLSNLAIYFGSTELGDHNNPNP